MGAGSFYIWRHSHMLQMYLISEGIVKCLIWIVVVLYRMLHTLLSNKEHVVKKKKKQWDVYVIPVVLFLKLKPHLLPLAKACLLSVFRFGLLEKGTCLKLILTFNTSPWLQEYLKSPANGLDVFSCAVKKFSCFQIESKCMKISAVTVMLHKMALNRTTKQIHLLYCHHHFALTASRMKE